MRSYSSGRYHRLQLICTPKELLIFLLARSGLLADQSVLNSKMPGYRCTILKPAVGRNPSQDGLSCGLTPALLGLEATELTCGVYMSHTCWSYKLRIVLVWTDFRPFTGDSRQGSSKCPRIITAIAVMAGFFWYACFDRR